MDPHALARELEASVRALQTAEFPAGYVEQARTAAAALAPFDVEPGDDVAAAASLLAAAAGTEVSVRAPTLVRRLVDWYLGFLLPPAASLGRAAARFGPAVVRHLDGVQARQFAGGAALRAEVAALRHRVSELEDRLGPARRTDPAGSRPSR